MLSKSTQFNIRTLIHLETCGAKNENSKHYYYYTTVKDFLETELSKPWEEIKNTFLEDTFIAPK